MNVPDHLISNHGKNFGNQMPIGYRTFYHSNRELLVRYARHGLNNWPLEERIVLDHLNTELVSYSDPHCTCLLILVLKETFCSTNRLSAIYCLSFRTHYFRVQKNLTDYFIPWTPTGNGLKRSVFNLKRSFSAKYQYSLVKHYLYCPSFWAEIHQAHILFF